MSLTQIALPDDFLLVPEADELLSPSLTLIPLQLFIYCITKESDRDIDQPRNLVKTVTVE